MAIDLLIYGFMYSNKTVTIIIHFNRSSNRLAVALQVLSEQNYGIKEQAPILYFKSQLLKACMGMCSTRDNINLQNYMVVL